MKAKGPKPGDIQTRTVTVERDLLAARAEGDDRIPVAISSEYAVERSFGREVLVHTREAIDMEHAAGGLPFLADHDNTRQLGLVEGVHLRADGKLAGYLRRGNHPDAGWYFKDIEDGIRTNLSAGYKYLDVERDGEDFRVTRWMPLEVSTVSVPADITVGVGRALETETQDAPPAVAERATQDEPAPKGQGERTMSEHIDGAAPDHKKGPVAVSLEDKQREMGEVVKVAMAHGVTAEEASSWVNQGRSPEWVKATLFERKIAEASKGSVAGHLDLSPREAAQFSYTRAMRNHIRQEWEQRGGLEKEVSDAVAKRLGRATSGFFVPLDMQIRAAATGNIVATSSLGGAGVQTSVLSLIDLLRNRMAVKALGARVLSGLTGNITFPRHIVANTMAWEGENPSTGHADTAATFDNVALSPKTAMASSAYSRQLLIQESFDVNAFIQDDLATVLAIGLDLAAIDGTGANNQPTGIMRQTGVTTITHTGTAAGGIPTFAEMVSYETQVATNNADIGVIAWLTNPTVRGKLKTVLKSTTAGSTYIWEGDNTINGYRAAVSSQVPSNYTYGTSTTVANGIVFGVWSELLIGEWGGAMEVIVDPYSLSSQNMVRITQMLLTDVAVRHPKAFAITKSALVA